MARPMTQGNQQGMQIWRKREGEASSPFSRGWPTVDDAEGETDVPGLPARAVEGNGVKLSRMTALFGGGDSVEGVMDFQDEEREVEGIEEEWIGGGSFARQLDIARGKPWYFGSS